MEVNVNGLIAMAQAFAPVLKANGGGVFVQLNWIVSMKTFPDLAISTYTGLTSCPRYGLHKFLIHRPINGLQIEFPTAGGVWFCYSILCNRPLHYSLAGTLSCRMCISWK